MYGVLSLPILSEITTLAKEVAALKPKVILEIGTARGGASPGWAHIAEKKPITCDLLDEKGFAGLIRAFPPPGSQCDVSVMVGDSRSAASASACCGYRKRRRISLQIPAVRGRS